MALSIEDVRHVALLARLGLTADEEAHLGDHLGRVLEYMARLDELDVTGVEAMAHPVPASQPERPDVSRPGLTQDEALAAAPQPVAGGFAVPRIIE